MNDNEKKVNGGISVQTEHIFPVIKKWLYSDKEIFLRELVSNACDAVSKLKRLSSLGEFQASDDEEYKIKVTLDKDAKTLTVSDNGIGMTADEVKKYICNIALSGALEFIEKYESSEGGSSIIGHFGLGFYSAFMVSDTVEIITKSYTGAESVHWTCNDAGEYTLEEYDGSDGEKTRGTDVILHINNDGEEFLSKYKCEEILEKYCSFMPVDIYLDDGENAEKDSDGDDSDVEDKTRSSAKLINDKDPLWMKNPSDCTDDEYRSFFKKVFKDMREPLFWVHINADYPLNFKGILYFPPIRSDYDTLEGQVKLYYNQVFVADNLKEVVPEYLLLLRGVLDCPELPLNVSRSYLQNSGYVSKISAHIIKKVADKLTSLFNNDRETYEKFWDDIRFFVEYGSMKDRKFYDRVKDILLIKLSDDSYVTIKDYAEEAKEKNGGKIYYTSDKVVQAQYVSMFDEQKIKVAVLSGMLDMQFMSFIEGEKDVKFMRVDSGIDALKSDGDEYSSDALLNLFKEVSGEEKLTVKFETLASESIPALLNISEEERRFADMMKLYGQKLDGFSSESTLVLNSKSPLIRKLGAKLCVNADDASVKDAVKQIYSLSLLAQRPLTADELRSFLQGAYSTLDAALGSN